jgi:hypothetical protein
MNKTKQNQAKLNKRNTKLGLLAVFNNGNIKGGALLLLL